MGRTHVFEWFSQVKKSGVIPADDAQRLLNFKHNTS
jgi:hypothetical protein